MGVVDPGLKTEGVVVQKVQQMEARNTRLRVSSSELLFNYTQISLFLKSHRFGKCSDVISLHIIGM